MAIIFEFLPIIIVINLILFGFRFIWALSCITTDFISKFLYKK